MTSFGKFSQLTMYCAVGALSLMAAACGGDGGTPTPTPPTTLPPTNRAPQFTSPASASVVENRSGTIYTAAATDPDSDTPNFSIAGGPDAAAFLLVGANLAFRELPDFERPADSDRDNVYNVTLGVADGRGGTASLAVEISVTNDKEGIAVRRIATGFGDPVGLGFLLATGGSGAAAGRIVVAQANGEIYDVDGTTGARTLLADVFAGRSRGRLLAVSYNKRRVSFYSGLFAMAQEPSGRVFVQRYGREPIAEAQLLPAGTPTVSGKIFEGPDRQQPGGDLFATISDESGSFAQDPNSRRGKLLFLEETDPFAGASVGPGGFNVRIVGSGIRRSGGAGAINGQILLADQGATLEHELTLFRPETRPLDFGWPGREGTQGTSANPPAVVTGPKIVYNVGTGRDQGSGVVFGGLYRGPVTNLDNRFVFGDRNGTIWSVPFADLFSASLLRAPQLDRRTDDFVPDVGRIESPVAFIVDDRGRMFILDSDGELFRVDAA